MWNSAFELLRRRLTFIYAGIFGVLILAVVAAAYSFIWWAVLSHEKQELIEQIYHEAEEWLYNGELPCSPAAVKRGSSLAYFIAADGRTVILNQLGDGAAGRALWRSRSEWPQQLDTARLLTVSDGQYGEKQYRYLAAVAPVQKDGEVLGHLYMFQNIDFYYTAAWRTLFLLLCVALLLFAAACCFGYWLAGKNIAPISSMYGRQQQFTADASHEMRTPLTVMSLALQGLEEDTESRYSSMARESLDILKSECRLLNSLTETLMELARWDEGAALRLDADVDMSALCREAGRQLALVAVSREISLRTEIADKVQLYGDEVSLRRLVIILLDNAVKYSPAGTTVTLRLTAEREQVVLEAADQGRGIPDADKEKVFYRFYRVDKARSRSQGGLGLGLSLAQAIVSRHHGSIKILDNKPCGTVVRVELRQHWQSSGQ